MKTTKRICWLLCCGKYSKLARDPIDQILYDNLEVQFRDLKLVYRRLPNEMKKMVMVHRSTEC